MFTMFPSVSLHSVRFCSFLQEYGIKGFPTIKVFAPGKPPVDYQGARDVKPIAEFALQQVRIETCQENFHLEH